MNNKLTEIVLVVDRSGSMATCKDDANGGIAELIKSQKEAVGDANITIVEFDSEYNFVCKGIDIKECPDYTLVPRGSTALLDAVGRAINETGERLSSMKEEDRPGLVVFAICTDGGENASQEFTKDQVKKMIEHQQEKYNWQFSFLGANQDAFAEAGGLGINAVGTTNYTDVKAAYQSLGGKFGRMRSQTISGQAVNNAYTPEEIEAMNK